MTPPNSRGSHRVSGLNPKCALNGHSRPRHWLRACPWPDPLVARPPVSLPPTPRGTTARVTQREVTGPGPEGRSARARGRMSDCGQGSRRGREVRARGGQEAEEPVATGTRSALKPGWQSGRSGHAEHGEQCPKRPRAWSPKKRPWDFPRGTRDRGPRSPAGASGASLPAFG